VVAATLSLLAIGPAGAIAAGCGSSKKTTTTKTTAAATALITQAKAAIDQAKLPLHFTAPGPPVDAAKVKGRSVLVAIVDARVPTLAEAATAMQQAGKVVGLNVSIFDAQANVSRMLQAVTQAQNQHVGALILDGIPIAIVRDKLATTNIPAIEVLDNDPVAGAPGQGAGPHVYATVSPPYTKAGQLLAYKAIIDTNGKANAVVFKSTSGADPSVPTAAGIQSVLNRCTGCKYVVTDTPLQDWSTKLAPLAQSEIRRNPSVNYMLPVFDGMGLFVVSGVREAVAGGHVKTAAFNGVPAGLSLVQKNDILVADPGQSNGWIGWASIDQAMRGMLGMKPADPTVPLRFFDSSNLKGKNVNDPGSLYGTGYIAGYKKLWGVK
jgi:ribose transport system substrate-binding protein